MRILVTLIAVCSFVGMRPAGVYRHDVDRGLHADLAKNAAFTSVGRIQGGQGRTLGSFVLVSPGWVLTAAHVVADLESDSLILDLGGERRTTSRVVVHPEFRHPRWAEHAEPLFRKGVDVALLELDRPVESIPAARPYRGADEVGQIATLVGYGTSGNAMTAITEPGRPGDKLAGQNAIDGAGGTVDGRPIPDWYLVSDFDHPDHDRLNKLGSPEPLPLEFMPVGGDSGGGAFIREKDTWFVAGIHATARISANDEIERDGLYGSSSLAVRVADIVEWLDETIAAGTPSR